MERCCIIIFLIHVETPPIIRDLDLYSFKFILLSNLYLFYIQVLTRFLYTYTFTCLYQVEMLLLLSRNKMYKKQNVFSNFQN